MAEPDPDVEMPDWKEEEASDKLMPKEVLEKINNAEKKEDDTTTD